MQIILNGEKRDCTSQTVLELITELGYADKRIAIELNGEIVPKSQHATTALKPDDQLEIVVAVGGG